MPAVQSIWIADRTARDPGVVHQDVQFPIGCHRLGDQTHPLRFTGYVNLRGHGLFSTGPDVGSHNFGFMLQDVGDNDLCAFRCEQTRFRLAHAVGTTSNDRNFPFEPHDSPSD